eukprot:g3683.t1
MQYPGKRNRLNFKQLAFVYRTLARRTCTSSSDAGAAGGGSMVLAMNWTDSLVSRMQYDKKVDPRAFFSLAHAWMLLHRDKLMAGAPCGIEKAIKARLLVSPTDALAAFEVFVVCGRVYPKLRTKIHMKGPGGS